MPIHESQPVTRKKFILWSSALLVFSSFLSLLKFRSEEKSSKNKFLTRDGKLVEVDPSNIHKVIGKMYTNELKDWVQKP